jgi:AcrR family transcriptional regulator
LESNPLKVEGHSVASETDGRVAQIVAEAARLFRDQGFAATSMNDVARRVGVSKPALYHHFASKEELFMAVATREPLEAARRMQALANDRGLSAAERLRGMLDCIYDNMILSDAGQMMPTIAETSAQFPELARRFRDGFIAAQQDAVTRIIADGVAAGEFKAENAAFACELTFGPPMMMSIVRAMYGHLADTPPLDLAGAKARHLASLLRALT